MENATYFKLKEYKEYLDFIEKCRTKTYNSELVLHSHHIIPKHLWHNDKISVDDISNIIKISVDDHIKAHLMLADCYDENTYEYISNMRSARILSKNSIKDKKTLDKITETYIGEKNPFYGKTHSEETKKILAEFTRNSKSGKTYEELYGIMADREKSKRKDGVAKYHKNLSDEERKIRSQNISNALKGKYSGAAIPNSIQLEINGVIYGSINEACRELNISRYKLFKMGLINKK